MAKTLTTITAIALGLLGTVFFLKTSSQTTALVWSISQNGTLLFPLVTISALIDSLNPCAFSILLLTVAFLFSLGILRQGILKIGVAYIFGVFAAYFLIGLGLLHALHLFNTPHFMGKLGAILLIILGLINLLGEFWPAFPLTPRLPRAAHGQMAELMKKSSLPAVFALGLLVGLCEFPCTGGPYLMVIGLLHDQETYWRGFGYLLWYNVLFIAPLAIVLWLASDPVILGKLESWKKVNLKRVKLIAGLLMIAIGALIFSI